MRQNSALTARPTLGFPGKRGNSSGKMWPNIVRGAVGIILRHAGFHEGFAERFVRSREY
jgi:hypothetical protein